MSEDEGRDHVTGEDRERDRFCEAAWPRLVDALTHYCGDVHLAEELVQEALIRAWDRWPQVATMRSPEAWTFRVAVNLANSRFRRRRAEQRARVRHGGDAAVHHDPDGAERQAVRAAMAGLSDRHREVVVLRYVLDLPADEVARLLGSTPGAVRTAAHRAVAELRRSLDVTTRPPHPDADPAVGDGVATSQEATDVP